MGGTRPRSAEKDTRAGFPRLARGDDSTDLIPGARENAVSGGGPLSPSLPPGFSRPFHLGRGGMGDVWCAVQDNLGRHVAVKVPRSDLMWNLDSHSREELLRSFLREARVTAYLEHPSIVPIYGLHTLPNGELQLVMRRVEGRNWEKVLEAEEGTMDRADFLLRHVGILLSLVQAVAYAHSKGIVHRDLKPSQVMVGDYGQVVVMDWGLAIRHEQDAFDPALEGLDPPDTSRQGQGTPAYMAPEQRQAEDRRLGIHTDIYQMGGILYRILVGIPPHSHRPVFPEDLCQDSPLQKLDQLTGVPEELVALARHCLQFDPERRPFSAEHVATRIQDWLGGRSRRERAAELLQNARWLRTAATGDFAALARAQAAFEQALAAWPDHPSIREEYDGLLQELIRAALAQGDLRYARTLLFLVGDHELLQELTYEHGQAASRAHSRELQRTWGLVLAVLFAITALSVLAGLVVYRDAVRHQDLVQDFQARSTQAARSLEGVLQHQAELLQGLAAFYTASDEVTSMDFALYTAPLLDHHPTVYAMEWAEEWPQTERLDRERRIRESYPSFQGVREVNGAGEFVPVTPRPIHCVVVQVAPRIGNESVLGLDLNHSPARQQTLERARDEQAIAATEPVDLVQDSIRGVLVVVPAYRREKANETVEERRKALIGYAIGVWKMEDLLRRGLLNRTHGTTSYRLIDRTAPAGRQFLASLRPTSEAPDPMDPEPGVARHTVEIEFAGRTYALEAMELLKRAGGEDSLFRESTFLRENSW